MQTVKFCAFADIHYYPGVFPRDSWEWLDRILAHAEWENVDFIIHCGDFTHTPLKCIDYVNHYNDFKIPTYHTIGNHDDDGNPHEVTLQCYRMERGYYHFDKNGFRFIILDPNYFKHDGEYIHFSSSNYYKFNDERDWIPPEQLEWFRDTVETSPYPCVCFSHESYERENHGIHNQDDVKAIINQANARHPGRVRLCINGHYHRDFLRILDNVIYFELNSANYEWVSKKHDLYPPEILNRWRLACNTVMFNDPVHAIITLSEDGRIKIDGMQSSLFMGVTREMTGNPKFDAHSRPTTANVQSIDLKMNY
ncbi:MAG: metallophosphoesterase [Victivallales bacterium]|nr:metallophosphoesterase [Victivallales bacterium]